MLDKTNNNVSMESQDRHYYKIKFLVHFKQLYSCNMGQPQLRRKKLKQNLVIFAELKNLVLKTITSKCTNISVIALLLMTI